MVKPGEVAPDRGWAFVVLAGTCIANCICALYATTGVFNVVFLEMFNKDKQTTAWIGSVHSSLVSLAGPISSIIINKFSLRWAYITGGFVAFLGFAITVFLDSFETIFITYGIVAGCGLGICFSSAVVTPSYYFDKYRYLANGICTTGFGVGIAIFSAAIGPAVDSFGWRGAMLLLGGMSLQCFITGAVCYPSALISKHKSEEKILDQSKTCNNGHDGNLRDLKSCSVKDNDEKYYTSITDRNTHDENHVLYCSMPAVNYARVNERQYGRAHSLRHVDNLTQAEQTYCSLPSNLNKNANDKLSLIKNESTPGIPVDSKDDIADSVSVCLEKCQKPSGKRIFDFDIFTNVSFLIFFLVYFLVNMGISISFMFIPVLAITNGSSKTFAYTLIVIIGFINIPSRIIAGIITSKKQVNIICTATFIYLWLGLISFFTPLTFSSKVGQIIASIFYGIPASVLYVLTPGVLVDIIGLGPFSSAVGATSFIMGVGFLVAPPLAGFTFDVTGCYDYGFYIAGLCYSTGGLLTLLIYRQQRNNHKEVLDVKTIQVSQD